MSHGSQIQQNLRFCTQILQMMMDVIRFKGSTMESTMDLSLRNVTALRLSPKLGSLKPCSRSTILFQQNFRGPAIQKEHYGEEERHTTLAGGVLRGPTGGQSHGGMAGTMLPCNDAWLFKHLSCDALIKTLHVYFVGFACQFIESAFCLSWSRGGKMYT